MVTLINANTMTPPIAPIGLDYIGSVLKKAGYEVELLDLCLAEEGEKCVADYFSTAAPDLVGVSFRNVDDCFWPSATSFVPQLAKLVRSIKSLTTAPVVLGGVGFSIFPEEIVKATGADFGVRGDGEQTLVLLLQQLRGEKNFEKVPGLTFRRGDSIATNPPVWQAPLSLPTERCFVDNIAYFEKGGQSGIETKRGCNRNCLYCADPQAKGPRLRLRDPKEVADEAESLLARGIDVFHTCDAEFNIPRGHALAVCEEFIRRGLGQKLYWYAYLAVTPFDWELACAMAKAGCVGINFTGDSASTPMLTTYRQPHRKEHLASAVKLCRENDIEVMIDLLLGGPGETPETVRETVDFIKHISPDCCGAPLGIRVYPGTPMLELLAKEGPAETNPNIKRKYSGPIDLLRPTFYISSKLGPNPARLVRDIIRDDDRFFPPREEQAATSSDHNYNDNTELSEAIAKGARGAYWHILHNLHMT